MKKYLVILITIILSNSAHSQKVFEGVIKFKIQYESLVPGLTNQDLAEIFGNSETAYVKEDKYMVVSENESGVISRFMVDLRKKHAYFIDPSSDTILRSDITKSYEELIKVQLNDSETKELNGKKLNSVTLIYKTREDDPEPKLGNGIFSSTLYFDPAYKVNTRFYKDFNSGYWNQYINLSKSISIISISNHGGVFKKTAVADQITREKVSNKLFEIDSTKPIKDI